MANRTENTPVELWPKVIDATTEVKLSVAEHGMEKYRRDLQKAIEVETSVLQHLNEPVEEMLGGYGAGPPASPSSGGPTPLPGGPGGAATMAGGPGGPSPGGPSGAPGNDTMPNPDELRRVLSD